MAGFIKKVIWFLVPVVLLHLFTFWGYNSKGGDLLRIGYIIDLYTDYHRTFKQENKRPIKYDVLSSKSEKRNYKIMTIGDSFSEQGRKCYKNYLADDHEVLHMDRFLSKNQINTLLALTKGDFFDHYQIENIVLQNVERHFVENALALDTADVLMLSDIEERIHDHHPTKQDRSYKFPSDRILKFPYYTLNFLLRDDYMFNDNVYLTKLNSDKFFSTKSDDLLFYHYDLYSIEKNNKRENVHHLNGILNSLSALLSQKGVNLIVLPAPDKYDIYYDQFKDNSNYPEPLFFKHLDQEMKSYIYINSNRLLTGALDKQEDIYYYGDAHWSPWAAKMVAKEIQKHLE